MIGSLGRASVLNYKDLLLFNVMPQQTKLIKQPRIFLSTAAECYDQVPRRDIILVIGDTNAKVGNDKIGYELIIGKEGLGTMNENGELFANFCENNELMIGGTVFAHRSIHKATWRSPDMVTEN